ncbi:MAG: hypothetical protein WDW38_011109 [Sanguina aurantia]
MLLGSCTAQVGIWTDMRARPRGIGNDDLWRCTAKDRGEQQRQYRQMQLGLSETMRRESAERLVRHKTQTQDPVYRPPFQPPQQTQPEAAANNKSLDLFAATMGSVREIMMSALVGMDQADEESAEAVEGLLRDVHGPAEASQIGHDLQAAAVFLILAMPEPGCSLEFVDRLISLAATIYKLVVRLTHPILLKSKDASSAAEAKDAATEGGLFDLHLFSRDMVGCPSIGSVTRRKRVRELDSDGGDLDEEIPSDFEGDSDEDEGADESDGESSYETVSDDHDYGTHTSPGEEQGSETTSGGIPLPIPVGEERVAVCRALLQLRALVMLSVLRLLEWHKWCEVEAELLKHTTVLVTALQSHLGRTHELQLQLEVPLSELDVPPFQMHLRVVEGSVGGVVGYHGPGLAAGR